MPIYVALLRGIAPLNPNMRNDKLRDVFEQLGFSNVTSVISSGNIIFESTQTNIAALEARIEKAWPAKLGFTSTTIIRSQDELKQMIARQPFKDMKHSQKTYLTVTFLKHPPAVSSPLPHDEPGYKILNTNDAAIFSTVDLTAAKTPNLMSRLEKSYGKKITTRTWQTVERIARAMETKKL